MISEYLFFCEYTCTHIIQIYSFFIWYGEYAHWPAIQNLSFRECRTLISPNSLWLRKSLKSTASQISMKLSLLEDESVKMVFMMDLLEVNIYFKNALKIYLFVKLYCLLTNLQKPNMSFGVWTTRCLIHWRYFFQVEIAPYVPF